MTANSRLDTGSITMLDSSKSGLGILICGHGSRAKAAGEEFKQLVDKLSVRFSDLPVRYGFLEYAAPNIHMALDSLLETGAKRIVAIPGMLFPATHTRNDIPSVLTTFKEKHPEVSVEYGVPLGLQEDMIRAFEMRILEAIGHTSKPKPGALYDTLLVVVGRGTSVPEANGQVAQLARIVCEHLGFGWSQTVYSGMTFPSVGRGLELVSNLGFKKIVVAPYLLFGGRLIERIKGYVEKVASENPDIQYLIADYLRDQDHVIDACCTRINECIMGPEPQLKPMEDFQQRLARGEVEVHHHHAEYQPEGRTPNAHSHTHTHSHAPYTHIGHPLGPRTMVKENICCCFMRQLPQWVLDEEQHKPERPGVPLCTRPKR